MDRKLVEVERGNVILKIPEQEIDRYLDQGYNLIDENGNVIKTSLPRDVGSLQLAYIQHEKEIAELKAELEKYKKRTSSKNKKREE